MEVEKIKALLMYEVLPTYIKQVGPCFTKEALKIASEALLKEVVKLVYPDYSVILRGVEEPFTVKQISDDNKDEEENFIRKVIF